MMRALLEADDAPVDHVNHYKSLNGLVGMNKREGDLVAGE